MQSPNYGDNPQHYKNLIAHINEEANFPMYLHQNGYKLVQQSAGSMEFQNDEDRIVLQTMRKPMTYFNRNDSCDKGLFFKYLLQRSANFYKAIESGLEITNRTYDLGNTVIKITKSNAFLKSLEEKYNIVPLRNSNYLRIHRGICKATINSPLFRGRIFNAYHIRDNGGRIANIAFPKYDLAGDPKNYILYNKPYRRRADNKVKKFRLVLNQKDHFLFHSKIMARPTRIIFGESGIDLLSYQELHGKKDDFYVSFGGNVHREKLQFFMQLITPMLQNKGLELKSIMDNDISGHEYDLKIFTALINQNNTDLYAEASFKNGNVSLSIHYTEKVRNRIASHKNLLEEKLTSDLRRDNHVFGLVRCVGFSDKLLLEFSLQEVINTTHIIRQQNVFKTLLDAINGLYLPFTANIHKSNGKDWNDDLMVSKKTKFIKMEKVVPKELGIGDQIELKSPKGPEGATNKGTIKSIKPNGVECDFGLTYTYAIPYLAIVSHFKNTAFLSREREDERTKKNDNLQNHIA
jgi:hypothetical protein